MNQNITGRSIISSLQDPEVQEQERENYVPIETRRILTGRAARQQFGDWLKNLAKKADPGEDDLVPLPGRAERRHAARREASQQERGQRVYNQQQALRARVVGDLAQQFAIIDGQVPARVDVVERVKRTLDDKARVLVDQDAARFSREYDAMARQFFADHPDQDALSPDLDNLVSGLRPVITADEAHAQLRELAA